MNLTIIGLLIFITSVIVIELALFGYRNMRTSKRARIRKKLRKYTQTHANGDDTEITRRRVLSENPLADTILRHIPGIKKIDDLILQANAPYQIGFFLLISLSLAIIGAAGVFLALRNPLSAMGISALLGVMPLMHLRILRSKRIEKFRKQFPEALELIARSLKAGHAFTSGLKLAADEFDDPIGPELSEAIDEINFGTAVPDALRNLSQRIDCPEIKFFTVAVNLQREAGGNLAEILESLAYMLRENFKFEGKVRVLAADGRMSAIILSVLPILLGMYIHLANPKYIAKLFVEPIGHKMLLFGGIMLVIGIITMKKMVNIKV
jgi:tight adherence protein B